jgi:hypothetical protein
MEIMCINVKCSANLKNIPVLYNVQDDAGAHHPESGHQKREQDLYGDAVDNRQSGLI